MIPPASYEILAMPDPSTIFFLFFFLPNVKSASQWPNTIMCPYSTPNSPDWQVQSFLTTPKAHKVPLYPLGISWPPSARVSRPAPPPTSQQPGLSGPAHKALCVLGGHMVTPPPPASHCQEGPMHLSSTGLCPSLLCFPCCSPPPHNPPVRKLFQALAS